MDLGKVGVWAFLDSFAAKDAAAFARRLEDWGYGALWQPETLGRNAVQASGWILANTERLVVATGIASIYARDAQAMKAAQMGLAEQSGGRFLLGLGVSHAPMVEGLRGHDYGKPVATMRAYLEAMDRAMYTAPAPVQAPPRVLAALGPVMTALSAERADGAHSYNVSPEHTAEARAILGPDKMLCVEQKVILETDAARARGAARQMIGHYLGLRNYQENWRRLGFGEDDWSNGGSDRLIDALFAWGDEKALRDRVRQHLDAGASHVCIQPVGVDDPGRPDERALAALAPSQS